MLTACREVDGRQVRASQAHQLHGPYLRAACGGDVELVPGGMRGRHFRHRSHSATCGVDRGETLAHRAAKESIWRALRESPRVSGTSIEHRIGSTNIADVFALIDGHPIAIEIQRSAISAEEMEARTLRYHDHGVFVLWLALLTEDQCFSRYRPKAWERWMHAAYGARVYYWVRGDEVQPIHFGPHFERVAERHWVSRERVQELTAARLWRSNTCRTPEHGPRLSIASDFAPRRRPAFDTPRVHVPRCSLFVDRAPVWWSPSDRSHRGRASPVAADGATGHA